MDEPADGQVGQDRDGLEPHRLEEREGLDPGVGVERLDERADQPEDVEIAGRVVVEERAIVEAERPLRCEVSRPVVERVEVRGEAGSRQQVCDDEAEGEPEGEDHQDCADGVPRPGRPRRRF